jgi:hypothetical protein
MVYSVHLFTVNPANAPALLLAFREGNNWHNQVRQNLPGLISTSTLPCRSCPTDYLVIQFWVSKEALDNAAQLPAAVMMRTLATSLAREMRDLGTFTLLDHCEDGESRPEVPPLMTLETQSQGREHSA